MELSPESAKHVAQVLRMEIGDQFVLTDGKGTKASVEIETLGKRDCHVRILEREIVENPNPSVYLAISFTKNNTRMEWLLEKITEIGIRGIYPIQSHRSERKEIKKERYHKKLVSAMLQSQQYHLPPLHEPMTFTEILKLEFDNKLIAHCEKEIIRKEIVECQDLVKGSTLICIGPEGDFTIEEIEEALQQNFKSVSLGKNRLRTETAGLVAVTLLNYYVP